MTLVLLSSPKQLGLGQLRAFFHECHTVIETANWIKKLREREVSRGPIKELLETVFKQFVTDKEPPHLHALRQQHPTLKKFSIDQLRSLVQSLEQLVPGYISLQNDIVSLQAPPDKILNTINQTLLQIFPQNFGKFI